MKGIVSERHGILVMRMNQDTHPEELPAEVLDDVASVVGAEVTLLSRLSGGRRFDPLQAPPVQYICDDAIESRPTPRERGWSGRCFYPRRHDEPVVPTMGGDFLSGNLLLDPNGCAVELCHQSSLVRGHVGHLGRFRSQALSGLPPAVR
jgi:hypothetical protein